MSQIKLACETYTWQMPGEQYKGKLPHIMRIMKQAGFNGIEPETSFFGELADPIRMKEELDKNDLELTALVHVEDWLSPNETEQERANAEQWIDFLKHFPDAIYLLVQMPGSGRSNLDSRQQNLLSCINQISRRATDQGITCSYHPNSPEGSIFRTEEDYKILLGGLDAGVIGYTPDIGHIAKVEMDPLAIIKEYRHLVNLVHYKDMFSNGNWAQLGEGDLDLNGITNYLVESGFEGWIVMEDECDRAISDPDQVTLDDGEYISLNINKLLK